MTRPKKTHRINEAAAHPFALSRFCSPAGVARGIVESRCPRESKAIRMQWAFLDFLISSWRFFFPAYDRGQRFVGAELVGGCAYST